MSVLTSIELNLFHIDYARRQVIGVVHSLLKALPSYPILHIFQHISGYIASLVINSDISLFLFKIKTIILEEKLVKCEITS